MLLAPHPIGRSTGKAGSLHSSVTRFLLNDPHASEPGRVCRVSGPHGAKTCRQIMAVKTLLQLVMLHPVAG